MKTTVAHIQASATTLSSKKVFLKPLLALLATAFISVGFTAHAADRYALVCITNNTSSTINFDFAWGEDDWETRSLEPGDTRYFAWEFDYANQNVAPDFYINFDSDMTQGEYWLDYPLERFAAPETDCIYYGSQYAFDYDSVSGNTIDLFGYNEFASDY
jgi:hypothetical protein